MPIFKYQMFRSFTKHGKFSAQPSVEDFIYFNLKYYLAKVLIKSYIFSTDRKEILKSEYYAKFTNIP